LCFGRPTENGRDLQGNIRRYPLYVGLWITMTGAGMLPPQPDVQGFCPPPSQLKGKVLLKGKMISTKVEDMLDQDIDEEEDVQISISNFREFVVSKATKVEVDLPTDTKPALPNTPSPYKSKRCNQYVMILQIIQSPFISNFHKNPRLNGIQLPLESLQNQRRRQNPRSPQNYLR
jgi:hypothetical protein